jgi:hypothetical protein
LSGFRTQGTANRVWNPEKTADLQSYLAQALSARQDGEPAARACGVCANEGSRPKRATSFARTRTRILCALVLFERKCRIFTLRDVET